MLFFMTIKNEEDRNKLTELFKAYSGIMFKTAYSVHNNTYDRPPVYTHRFCSYLIAVSCS